MERLTRSWNNLSLSEKERNGFILPKDRRRGEFLIAAKFFTTRFLQMEGVAQTFRQLWRTTNGFKIRNQGNNIVLFVFDNLQDVDKILKSQPWSFDKHLIIMQRYVGEMPQYKSQSFRRFYFGCKSTTFLLAFRLGEWQKVCVLLWTTFKNPMEWWMRMEVVSFE